MNKTKLLTDISKALQSGVISKSDVLTILDGYSAEDNAPAKNSSNRVSAVDIMFYIAGVVLFAAIMALVSQAWDSDAATRIFLSAGLGTIFWAIAIYLIQSSKTDDIRSGMSNALLLTGSLSLIAGGFIIASEFVSYIDFHFYATSITLTFLGVLHIAFGRQIKRDLITLMGVLLAVAAFPSFVFGLFADADVPMFAYWLILAISGGVLAYATRVVSWIGASSPQAARAFDSLSAFGVLASLYAASYDSDTGVIWLLALIAGIVGLFYLSIIKQDKLMLGNGSLFLVITIITISARYFSGYGIATSLFISAVGLIGTAVVATTINRRYMK